MNKRLILILISTALILAISVSPVFALGSRDYKNYQTVLLTDGSNTGNLNYSVYITSLSPFLNNVATYTNDGEYSATNPNTPYSQDNSGLILDVEQEFVILVRMYNSSTQTHMKVGTTYGQVNIPLIAPSFVTTPRYQTGVELKEVSGDLFKEMSRVGTTTSSNLELFYRWNTDYCYNQELIVPKQSVLQSQVILSLHTYMYVPGSDNNDAFQFISSYLDSFYYSINDIISSMVFPEPSSNVVTYITDFDIPNADYNSIDELEILDYLYQELVRVRDSMTTANTWLHDIYQRIDQMESYTDALESINTSIYQWERLNTLMNIQKYNALNSINPTLTLNINTNNDLNTTFAQNTDDEDQIIQQYMVYVDDVNWNPFTITVGGDVSSQVRASADWWKTQFSSTFRIMRAFAIIPMYALTLSLALYIIHHRIKQ